MQPYTQLIDQYLADQAFVQEPKALYEPMNYILQLGGKRLRPILTLMGSDLFGGKIEEALPAAFSVELFHNFSLMHDDIMDDAPLRRGQATVHTKYNASTAILSGDAMLIKSFEYLQQYDDSIVVRLTRHLTQTSLLVCEGQQKDMDFENTDQVSIPDYLQMIEWKTAVLLAEALRFGAIVAGGNDHAVEHIYQFGRNMGIAFQIQDDILDVYGDMSKVGKQQAGDIIQGKKTYLYLKALDLSTPDQRNQLKNLYQSNTLPASQKIKEVMQIFNELHVANYAEELKLAYRDLALSHLDEVGGQQDVKDNLIGMSNYILKRAE